ncbi:PQQ-dependent sugar dehydrogenase [Sphingomonas sabuli]|uniref:PQQ-dependent sugar dehydrogenase n=1 Tax=Sphingomonas sabuli TaxID=2764186 RepID=A0A7G9L570_9SPHN|nr:PQQ-dependent sugar dehydrogenase [Sphingomonas sabuli]QNM83769.1 PQQ-dependent sugar dehydrogenase [Sphingomonas sabuli]
MTLRSLLSPLVLAVAACGASGSGTAQPSAQNAGTTEGARPFTTAEVASFDDPWAISFIPGSGVPLTNQALVTEKGGKLWLVDVATGKRQEVGGVPAVHVAGQGGLGDVVVHPDHAGNHRVYLSFVERGADGTSGAAIGYGTLVFAGPAVPSGPVAAQLTDFKVIWRQDPKVDGNGHFSHRIAFAPDGTMFISSGDRQKMQPAQDRNVDLGKIIHLTAEGERIDGRWYSMGHRNVLGLAFDAQGRLWNSEMGPKGGDEINLIAKGKNYGWPLASYGSHYDGADIPDDHKGRGYEEPKVWWTPSISPAGLMIYKGTKFAGWTGDALVPALSGHALIRVDLDGDTARKGDQWEMGSRIRAVSEGPEGSVYLLEDGNPGRLLRLEPAG